MKKNMSDMVKLPWVFYVRSRLKKWHMPKHQEKSITKQAGIFSSIHCQRWMDTNCMKGWGLCCLSCKQRQRGAFSALKGWDVVSFAVVDRQSNMPGALGRVHWGKDWNKSLDRPIENWIGQSRSGPQETEALAGAWSGVQLRPAGGGCQLFLLVNESGWL